VKLAPGEAKALVKLAPPSASETRVPAAVMGERGSRGKPRWVVPFMSLVVARGSSSCPRWSRGEIRQVMATNRRGVHVTRRT